MFFITVMTRSRLNWSERNCGKQRCVGFYNTFSYANEAVLQNIDNIHEDEYDYVVIEEVKNEGVYPFIDNEFWYQWDNGQYRRIDPPVGTRYLTNFCLG